MSEWLTLKDIAQLSGLKYDTLFVYRRRGILPVQDHQIGNKPLWSKETIDPWLTARTKTKERHNDTPINNTRSNDTGTKGFYEPSERLSH